MSDLISRSRLIEEIKRYQMDIVSKATAMKVIRNAPTVTDTNVGGKWIPCSERLPDNDTDVLICSGEFVHEAHFKDGHFSNSYGMWYKSVTHWMPLPEPYKASVKRVVAQQPTVEAVPVQALTDAILDKTKVVRCKDCKHSDLPAVLTRKYGKNGTLTCHNKYSPCNNRNVNEKDFCSHGEMRTSAE